MLSTSNMTGKLLKLIKVSQSCTKPQNHRLHIEMLSEFLLLTSNLWGAEPPTTFRIRPSTSVSLSLFRALIYEFLLQDSSTSLPHHSKTASTLLQRHEPRCCFTWSPAHMKHSLSLSASYQPDFPFLALLLASVLSRSPDMFPSSWFLTIRIISTSTLFVVNPCVDRSIVLFRCLFWQVF